MNRQPEIHTFDGADHGEAYDFSMVSCRAGDFVEMADGGVIKMVEAWPVLIIGHTDGKSLHHFDKDHQFEVTASIEQYQAAKNLQRKNGIQSLLVPESLQVEQDNTAFIGDLPGYRAEVRAVMHNNSIDYFEIYDTESGECLNEGSPIHEWPTSDEEIDALMIELKSAESPRVPSPQKPSSGMKMGM